MKIFTSRLRQFAKSEDGISSVEYALLLAFVGGGIIAGASALSTAVSTEMTDAKDCLAADPNNLPTKCQ